MNTFDKQQIEEEPYFNLVDEDDIFIDEGFDDSSFNDYMNSSYDF